MLFPGLCDLSKKAPPDERLTCTGPAAAAPGSPGHSGRLKRAAHRAPWRSHLPFVAADSLSLIS